MSANKNGMKENNSLTTQYNQAAEAIKTAILQSQYEHSKESIAFN